MADQTQALQGESVDRIRDIIFGPKMRDYEQRFEAVTRDLDRLQQEVDRLNEQLANKDAAQGRGLQALRQDLTKTAGELRNELKAEAVRLNVQMNEHNTAQSNSLQAVRSEFSQADSTLTSNLKADIEQLTGAVAENEAGQKASLQHLRQELRKADTDLREELRQIMQRLTDEKTDRGALGDLFIELGEHVKNGGSLADMLKNIELPG